MNQETKQWVEEQLNEFKKELAELLNTEENNNCTALQLYKDDNPMQIFFNKSSTKASIFKIIEELLEDTERNIFGLNDPHGASLDIYDDGGFVISSDNDYIELFFQEITLL